MAHIHGVYDTDARFSIDPITRAVKNESTTKLSVIQWDHNSERFTFECQRFIEEHDMSTCNVIEIHYVNIDAATKQQSKGLYEVEDMQIDPENENVITFSWLISSNATQLKGNLNFVISFRCVTDDEVQYAWNTGVYKTISVSEGMNNGDSIAEEYPDILAGHSIRIEALEADNGVYSWNDLTDKPFGEVGGDTLTWDGNTEGKDVFETMWYHVSDCVPDASILANGVSGVLVAEGEETPVSGVAEETNGVYILAGELGFVVPDEVAAQEGISPGIYLMSQQGSLIYVKSLTIPGYTGFTTIKKLDAKFLPDDIGTGTGGITEEEKAALVDEVLAALPTWEGGSY